MFYRAYLCIFYMNKNEMSKTSSRKNGWTDLFNFFEIFVIVRMKFLGKVIEKFGKTNLFKFRQDND